MFTKEDFLESVEQEIRVCQHLYTKVDTGLLDYRQGDGMRTTLELLRYLTYAGLAPAEALVRNDWSGVSKHGDAVKEMPASEFPDRMGAQAEKIRTLVEGLGDDELRSREVELPWGGRARLGPCLVNMSLKFLACYRLQLFDNLKAAGRSELNTYNAWLGVDAPESSSSERSARG